MSPVVALLVSCSGAISTIRQCFNQYGIAVVIIIYKDVLIASHLHILDKEYSEDMKKAFRKNNVDFQLVPIYLQETINTSLYIMITTEMPSWLKHCLIVQLEPLLKHGIHVLLK